MDGPHRAIPQFTSRQVLSRFVLRLTLLATTLLLGGIAACLAKDPDERYQSIKEVAIELKELRRELESNAGIDTTVPSAVSSSTALSTDGGSTVSLTAARSGSMPPTVSSAEFLLSGISRHKLGAGVALAILLVLVFTVPLPGTS